MSTYGAKFRKCDLQIHSPRDSGWEGKRPEDGIQIHDRNARAEARLAYCKSFITKCLAEGLQAIAVTDHHEGVYCYCIIKAKEEMEAEQGPIDLWIFPAMELTCKDSCQALIIFDADLPQNLFEKARAQLRLPTDFDSNDATGIQVELLDFNIADLQETLESDPELCNRFIVLPHVKPDGHKTVLRKGFHKRFKELPYVGGYMDRCYPHDLKDPDRRILDGEIPAWASEKRGVVCTSDARHADFQLIGRHATWIKLATPTAESLRQALLAPDCRIRYEPPNLPGAIISSIAIEGSRYLNDGTYHFNAQMNSIIGGRGAGKSTLLEYIRFALGCSAVDSTSTQDGASERMKELLLTTLDTATGRVTVNVLLNGASVTFSRKMDSRAVIEVVTSTSTSQSSVDEVQSLIPTQQFRQGELSELAREDAAERLLSLVTAQAAKQIADIENKLKANGQALSETLAQAVRLSRAKHTCAHAETQSALLRAQIANLNEHLDIDAQASAQAIASHDRYIQQEESLGRLTAHLADMQVYFEQAFNVFVSDLTNILEDQPIIQDVPKLSQAYQRIREAICMDNGAKGELLRTYDDSLAWFANTSAELDEADREWKARLQTHENEYKEQKENLADKQAILESLENLKFQLHEVSLQSDLANADVKLLTNADNQLHGLRSERAELQSSLHAVVSKQLETVETVSAGLAKGQLSNQLDFAEAASAVRSVLDLRMLRESRLDTLITSIKNSPDVVSKWEKFLDELIDLIKWKEGAVAEQIKPPSTPILQNALGDNFMDTLREQIDIDRVSTALRVVLRPRAEISQIRGEKEIEFRRASQGEQAATLLNILMNQSTGPLIIDQPEEDLDNRIINEIIRTIRKTKDVRQLILATHNANITVNGDSENVIEMVFGKRQAAGAIDEQAVREAVTQTMEGGKDAFELRRRKYNF